MGLLLYFSPLASFRTQKLIFLSLPGISKRAGDCRSSAGYLIACHWLFWTKSLPKGPKQTFHSHLLLPSLTPTSKQFKTPSLHFVNKKFFDVFKWSTRPQHTSFNVKPPKGYRIKLQWTLRTWMKFIFKLALSNSKTPTNSLKVSSSILPPPPPPSPPPRFLLRKHKHHVTTVGNINQITTYFGRLLS